MTAAAVRATSPIPIPRSPRPDAGRSAARSVDPAAPRDPSAARAVAYQRVLHQLVRRELRMLGELATWAPAAEPERTTTLTRHAELIGRVLLHHHTVERETVWPVLLRAVAGDRTEVVAALADWTEQCARVDHMLRDSSTAARQWQVTATLAARDVFALACLSLADGVDAQTAAEEATLLPLLGEHLEDDDWAAIAHSSHCRLSGHDQMVVFGLALEDSCAGDRARLLSGLPPAARVAWRVHGHRTYRAAVVRLRGAPPAS